MTDDAALDLSTDEHDINPMVHIIVPLVAMAATWAVRKAMNSAYRKVTSSNPPNADDYSVTWRRAIIWSAVTAASAAVVEVAVVRAMNRPH